MPRRDDDLDRLSPGTIARLRELQIDPGTPYEGLVSITPTPPAPVPARPYDYEQEAS